MCLQHVGMCLFYAWNMFDYALKGLDLSETCMYASITHLKHIGMGVQCVFKCLEQASKCIDMSRYIYNMSRTFLNVLWTCPDEGRKRGEYAKKYLEHALNMCGCE